MLVVGVDLAASLSWFLAYGLAAIGFDAEAPIGSEGNLEHRVRSLTSRDLLLAISFGRCLRITVEAARRAKRHGVSAFGITDSDTTPIARVCESYLLAPISASTFTGSYAAPMVVVNAVLVACAQVEPRRALARLRQSEKEYLSSPRWYDAAPLPDGRRPRSARETGMTPGDWLARFEERSDRLAVEIWRPSSSGKPFRRRGERSPPSPSWVRDRLRERGVAARDAPVRGRRRRRRRPEVGPGGDGALVLGHLDTVWPAGTLADIPFRVDGDRATGPGIFDMKAGIAVAMAALEALVGGRGGKRDAPARAGRGDRKRRLPRADRWSSRAGTVASSCSSRPTTARRRSRARGTGLFRLRFRGRAAHAGLEPERGASALAELARCRPLSRRARRSGQRDDGRRRAVARSGGRTNVVPEDGELAVDARVWSREEAERLEGAVRSYRPADSRVSVSVEGGFDRPPLEPTPESLALFERARAAARDLGFDLASSRVGGASDGNLTAAAGDAHAGRPRAARRRRARPRRVRFDVGPAAAGRAPVRAPRGRGVSR